MGSRYPTGFYDEERVAVLERAFREIWKTIMTNDPFRNVGRDETLRQTIVRTMIKLSDDGVANVDELRDKTLALVITGPERPMPPPRARRRRAHKAA